jgi:hypothetical protein
MSVLQQLAARLAALESRLADRPEEAGEVRAIRAHLTDIDSLWIGTREARRLLGVNTVATVKAWARLGLLRSRPARDGRLLVYLEDVLEERQVREDLRFGDDEQELSSEELHEIRRQLQDPIERARIDAVLVAAGIPLEPTPPSM